MSQLARNNSHASSACVNCRNRKRKCSGSGPTCASCAEKNIQVGNMITESRELNKVLLQCEWMIETDGRRIGRNLQLENASLRAELAELRALVDALRAGALEELSYYATHQLPCDLDGELAALALQTTAHQQHSTHDAPFDGRLHDLLGCSHVDSRSSCPTNVGQTGAPAPPSQSLPVFK